MLCEVLLNTLNAGYFFMLLVLTADFFSKLTFSKKSFRNTIRLRVSNSLGPDQDGHSVSPDLGSNCLQRLSSDNKVAASKERDKQCND